MMWSRKWPGRAFAAAALATILSCPAGAQIEDSGLEQVDPWGVSYLGEDEPTLRTRMWRGSRGEDLLAIVQGARTQNLTPAERMLMRRLALSPARAPGGETQDALLAERARIAFELGEAEAAAGQMDRLPEAPPGTDPEVMAADLNLVLGNEATACDRLNQPDLEGDYWAKLRAVCAVLAGNTSGAELAMEMAQVQGVEDAWLSGAIFAASGATPNPPKARFDSGLTFAMSNRANLDVPDDAVPDGRPDLAAAMARRKLMRPSIRVKAAGIAAEAGLITPEEYRVAYNSALAADGFAPATALDKAIFIASDGTAAPEDKAKALAAALKKAAGKPSRFAAISALLLPNLARLPVGPETEAETLVFARASLAAGDLTEARRWITPLPPEPPPVEEAPEETPDEALTEETEDIPAEPPLELADLPPEEPLPEPEPELPSFEVARMAALIVLADAEADRQTIDETARTLMAVAGTDREKRAAAQVFALWTGAGMAPPSDARAYLAEHGKPGIRAEMLPQALAVLAATHSGAAAETVISTLALTDGDPSKLDLADLTLLLTALRAIGAEDAARLMALEASGYWKASE